MKPNPEYIQKVIERLKDAPYPRHLNMRIVSLEIDRSVIEICVSPFHFQTLGIVHGGVIATLLDTATFWAAFLRVPEADGLVNIDLKLNYLKSATEGTLTAEGFCVRPGKTVSYAEAKVYDSSRSLIAHGTSSLMTLSGKGLNVPVPKFLEE